MANDKRRYNKKKKITKGSWESGELIQMDDVLNPAKSEQFDSEIHV